MNSESDINNVFAAGLGVGDMGPAASVVMAPINE